VLKKTNYTLGDERGVPQSTSQDDFVWHASEDQLAINQDYVANLKASKICMGFEESKYDTCAQVYQDPRNRKDYKEVELFSAPKVTSGIHLGDDAVRYETCTKEGYQWNDILPPS
jgi:hypothetical protein